VQRELGFIEPGQRQVTRAGDLFAGMLIRLADVDQDRALVEETPGVEGAYFWKRHD
jgi:hypothetical protein